MGQAIVQGTCERSAAVVGAVAETSRKAEAETESPHRNSPGTAEDEGEDGHE